MKFIHSNDQDQEVASVSLVHLWDRTYALLRHPSQGDSKLGIESWRQPLLDAIAAARQLDAKEVTVRVIEEGDWSDYVGLLNQLGFVGRHRRVEFSASLDLLPDESGSPLAWEPMASEGTWTLSRVSDFLREVAQGDPHFDPSADTLAELQSYLADPHLTSGPDCVHVGYFEGQPIALVIAQIMPHPHGPREQGWSRITYMGVLPSFRSKGLGKWVHRHGFTMMRTQGGTRYQGGTDADNHAMRRIFAVNGCPEWQRMQELALDLGPSASE